jgi:hypothetical protein
MNIDEQRQKKRDEDAKAAAEFVYRCWMHKHGGTLDLEDKFLLFNNRPRRMPFAEEQALAVGTALEAMGWDDLALGWSTGDTYCWVVFNYQRRPVDWDALYELSVAQNRKV